MNPFKNYKFGHGGVNVDASPAHLSSEELLQAQNAIRDPLGVDGGLKNRPGLAKFNTIAMSGLVVGGVTVPSLIPTDTRTIYLAEQNGASAEKWYSSSDLFATSAEVTAIGAWQDPTAYYTNAGQVSRMGAFFNGQLYYASADYTSGSTSPKIRVFNGSDDREISKLLPATTLGITGLFAQKGYLYILTLDSGTSDADFIGRVFRMSETGELRQIGTALATGYVPMTLAVHHGLVFVGTGRLTTTNEARVYRINPLDETSWTLDNTFAADDYLITSLQSFQGLLYATTKNGGAATKGKVVQRSVAGVWATVDSTVNNTGSYEGLAEFGGYLYASSRNYDTTTNTAVIRRSADGSTWATVYNATATTGVGLLNAIGLRLFSMGGVGLLHTLNGTSWTAATPAGTGNCDGALGVLVRTGAAQWSDPAASSNSAAAPNVVNVTAGGLANFDTLNDVKRGFYIAVAGTTIENVGLGTLSTTGLTSNADQWTDSRYVEFRDAGGANTNMGLVTTSNRATRLGFFPTLRARIRTHDNDQTQYYWWIGLFNQTSASDTDTLTAEGIAFRYLHPVGSSGDSGNWNLSIHDGTSQVDTDTGVAVQGGTAAGSHIYDMYLDFSAAGFVTWRIDDITAGTSTTGTVAISGSFDTTAPLGIGCWGTDVPGGIKVIHLSSLYLTTK